MTRRGSSLSVAPLRSTASAAPLRSSASLADPSGEAGPGMRRRAARLSAQANASRSSATCCRTVSSNRTTRSRKSCRVPIQLSRRAAASSCRSCAKRWSAGSSVRASAISPRSRGSLASAWLRSWRVRSRSHPARQAVVIWPAPVPGVELSPAAGSFLGQL